MERLTIMDFSFLLLFCFHFIIINVNSQPNLGPKYLYNKNYDSNSEQETLYPIEHPNDVEEPEQSNEIPREVFEAAQSNPEEFLKKYVNQSLQTESDELSHDFQGVDVARRSTIVAKQATCTPITVAVPVMPNGSSSSTTLIYPSCIFVKRCGGCCASPALECQPTETTVLNVPVSEHTDYRNGQFQTLKNYIVPIEQHDRCTCQCKIKKEDCNKYQEYDAKNCRCNCINYDSKQKCHLESHKIWLPDNCTCSCRKYEDCTTGLYFNLNECRCTKKIATTQLTPIVSDVVNRRQFILPPIVIDPDSNTSYDTQEG